MVRSNQWLWGSSLLVVALSLVAFFQNFTATGGEPSGITPDSSATSGDIATINNRLIANYLTGTSSGASQYLVTQGTNGSWPDINYADQSASWAALTHLARLEQMAISYQTPTSSNYRSAGMLAGIQNGLNYWFSANLTNPNWWDMEIGEQLYLEQILILMNGYLPNSMIQTGAGYFFTPAMVSPPATGENLIWFAGEQFVRGVLLGTGQDISDGLGYITSALTIVTAGEGLQTDYSFHQHGTLFNGGYGLGALSDGANYGVLVSGTSFGLSPTAVNNLVDLLLQGTALMVRGPMLDYGASGRYIARPSDGLSQPLLAALPNLAVLSPNNQSQFSALQQTIQGTGLPYSFLGHKHFWNSDFTAHQRAGYYTSVKMISNRVSGTESLNGENLMGFWVPFGLNFIAQTGTEYAGIFPVWDWTHLPGVTSPEEIPVLGPNLTQSDSFVGGASDGTYGVAGMQLDMENGTSIHAHKSWFFFDNEFVALGAGISSTDAAPVSTTLNQTLLSGTVVANGATVPTGEQSLTGISWVLHGGIGYVFPSGANMPSLTLSIGPRSGTWNAIDSLESTQNFTHDVFALWLNHGAQPTNASYQYIVVPDTNASALQAYSSKPPVSILANTTSIQAVRQTQLGISELIFYAPGSLSLGDGLSVSVDQPCFVVLQEGSQSEKLTVSSPSGPLLVHVTITNAAGGAGTVAIQLPGAAMSGTSQTVSVPVNYTNFNTGFYSVATGKTVYYLDGEGTYCTFADEMSFFLAGGNHDFSNVSNIPEISPPLVNTGTCVGGFFLVPPQKTIYYGNGREHYCAFATWQNFLASGGRSDLGNVNALSALPNMISDGSCPAPSSNPAATPYVPFIFLHRYDNLANGVHMTSDSDQLPGPTWREDLASHIYTQANPGPGLFPIYSCVSKTNSNVFFTSAEPNCEGLGKLYQGFLGYLPANEKIYRCYSKATYYMDTDYTPECLENGYIVQGLLLGE